MTMNALKGFQKRYLKGLAHNLKPTTFIGRKGLTQTVLQEIDKALENHELIKVKFIDFKEKEQKKEISTSIEKEAQCQMTGMIGHIAIFYRQQSDPEKRTIAMPERSS
jgi:RNA-binding protein